MEKQNVTMVDLVNFIQGLQGLSFVGLREYTNKQNEVANHTINVGGDYGKMKSDDYQTLTSVTADRLLMWASELDMPFETVETAYNELVSSVAPPKPTDKPNNRSLGQQNAYINLGNGFRFHIKSQKLHLWGARISKRVLVEGKYKKVVSDDVTVAKNHIKKALDLKSMKFRNFIVANVSGFRFGKKALNIRP